VDNLGGIDVAIALVKQQADIPNDEEVTLREVSFDRPSLQQVLSAGTSVTGDEVLRLLITDPVFMFGTLGFTLVPLILQVRPMTITWRIPADKKK
jgi:hypothetical protein